MVTKDTARPMKQRTTIWLMLGVVLTLAVILLFSYACTTGQLSALVYRYTHSGKWLYSALYHGVNKGDTIEQVESLLGPGRTAGSARIINVSKKFAQSTPALWPDGVDDGDIFLGFLEHDGELFLQFRDGVLVNFDPNEYSEYDEIIATMGS